MKFFLDFGCYSVKELTKLIYWTGAFVIAIASWFIARTVALMHVWHRPSEQGYAVVQLTNWPFGIFVGVLCFAISILLWRMVCEMIYIILSYFKENTPRKEKEVV